MNQPVRIKADRRFKRGNIKVVGTELRGNPETVEMKLLDVPVSAPLSMQLNPPIVVTHELGEVIRKQLGRSQ